MNWEEFEQYARAEWDRIPEQYRAGVDGLVLERHAVPHRSLPDVFTLGECITESYPSEVTGPDTTRSSIVLYYGSFFRLSRLDPDFDWRGEIWETLAHELQHHLESLATDDDLAAMDYAADENYKRYEGESYDPWFFRQGLPDGPWRRIEDEYFLEVLPPVPGRPVWFEWDGSAYNVAAPSEHFDIAFLEVVDGVTNPAPALYIVVVRRRTLLDVLRDLFVRRAPVIIDRDVVATPDTEP